MCRVLENSLNNCMQRILSKLVLLGLTCIMVVQAQVTGTLTILSDTVPLGRPVDAVLVVKSPKNLSLQYPDTLKDFRPYEFIQLKRASTEKGNTRVDTLVYTFRTFEIAPIQILTLSVLALNKKDTVINLVLKDTIHFSSRLPLNKNDSLELHYHEDLIPIETPPDYISLALFICLVILIIGIGVVLLYKPVKRWIIKRQIIKEYNIIIQDIEQLNPSNIEDYTYGLSSAVKRWCSEGLSFRLDSLTTSEIRILESNPPDILQEELAIILELSETADRILYAGITPTSELPGIYKQKVIQVMKGKLDRRLKAIR